MKMLLLHCVLFMSFAIAKDKPSNGVSFVSGESSSIKLIQVDKNKKIKKYPSPSKVMEYNVMLVNGRSPVKEDRFIYNTLVHFMIYVTKGTGVFFVDNQEFNVGPGAVLDVPPKTRFAVHGEELEYLTVENPAWFPEQFHIVDSKNNIVLN